MTTLQRLVFSCVLFISFVHPVLSQKTSAREELLAVIALQDARVTDPGRWESLLASPSAKVRARAALAAGSVQDSALAVRVAGLLSDPDPVVRKNAAFAVGQSGVATLSPLLLTRLGEEKKPAVVREMAEAVGKLGNGVDLDSLVASGAGPRAIAWGVMRFGIRGIATEASFRFLAENAKNPKLGYPVAYTLGRLPEIPGSMEKAVRRLIRSSSAEVRMNAVLAAGKLRDSSLIETLVVPRLRDRDWRVRVNAVRSIGKAGAALSGKSMKAFLAKLKDKNLNVAVTAVRTLPDVIDKDDSVAAVVRSELERILHSKKSETLRGEAGVALARIFGPDAFGVVMRETRATGERLRARLSEALGYIPLRRIVQELYALDPGDSSLVVRIGVLKGIRHGLPYVDDDSRDLAIAFCFKMTRTGDVALTATAAEVLADTNIAVKRHREIARYLAGLLPGLHAPDDIEAITAICSTLGKLERPEAVDALKGKLAEPDHVVQEAAIQALQGIDPDIDVESMTLAPAVHEMPAEVRERVAKLGRRERIRIKTDKGAITVELYPDAAPVTVARILELVEKKFYDGLEFHRVVPNFVVQGGDPLGNGWGGPGWTMRSEFSTRRFERGSVGIASAGKDTEGCQLFITHCATPHLDGRYTNFGKVVRGMKVVDRLEVGDRILSVKRL